MFHLIFNRSPIPDPDKRLTKTNKMCESFHWILIQMLTKVNPAGIISTSAASILVCQLKYGLGQVKATELNHLVKAV